MGVSFPVIKDFNSIGPKGLKVFVTVILIGQFTFRVFCMSRSFSEKTLILLASLRLVCSKVFEERTHLLFS